MLMPTEAKRPVLTIHRAQTFFARLGGLLTRARLREGEALYLAPCASVHTMFMRYPIDVAFLDAKGRVLKVVPHLKPWRVAGCFGAAAALELRAGQAQLRGIAPRARVNVARGAR
jgi:uncharacterized membrane protein (UPF0127 family)